MTERPVSERARALSCLVIAALLILALFVPWMFENQFGLYLLDMALINAVIALGLNVVLKTGQVSMAHAGFMAIGAYTSAQLTVKLDVPFLVGFVAAGLGAALVALGLGRIILRLKGVYPPSTTWCSSSLHLPSPSSGPSTGHRSGGRWTPSASRSSWPPPPGTTRCASR